MGVEMNTIVKCSVSLGLCFALSGCLLANMEKITEDTRDEVRATNQAIHAQEDLVKISRMHSSMIDPGLSISVRVNAAKAVLAKYPENMLASDLGMLLPSFKIGSFKRSVGGAEAELLNVPYVGEKKISRILGVAAIDSDLLNVVSFAAIQLTSELEAKTKSAGISADDMANYRGIAKRLALIVPAILGSLTVEPLEQTIQGLLTAQTDGSIQPGTFAERLQASTRSGVRAVPAAAVAPTIATLEQLAINTSMAESEIAEMRALISVRLGIN
jgi:hypothetical protein